MQTLRRTPLHGRHEALGARLVPFAGWELPVQYSSAVDEHLAVRERAGVFDVSHMGQLERSGRRAHDDLQARLSNDLDRIDPGGAQYTLLLGEAGGVVDDLIAYRRDDGYLLVVNAANVARDAEELGADDVSADWAMLAVQGPDALALLELELEPFTWREAEVLGVRCVACGTGYTGELGCELLCAPADAGRLWDAILGLGVTPCGLAARDSLRLEACYPLHGQDLTEERTPVEAGLSFACAFDKELPGIEVLRRQKERGPEECLVAFRMGEKAIPRPGMAVHEGGIVTSGGWSPVLEAGIGLAYVPAELGGAGAPITIDVRGRERAAEVVRKPFVKRKES